MPTNHSISLRHIYISPGHNYFGHHGKEPDQHPIHEVESVECVAGRGLKGDRFFDYKENYKGQITFFDWERYEDVCEALNLPDLDPSVCRRNVITEGVDLNTLIGKTFSLQGIQFEADSECSPCYWMDKAFGPGAEDRLKGFGGLRARILSDGKLTSGVCELFVLG